MTDVDAVDFFTDRDLLADPYDYFAALRTECPVRAEKHHGVTMLTGYDEVVQVNTTATTSPPACPSPARSPGSRYQSARTTTPTR